MGVFVLGVVPNPEENHKDEDVPWLAFRARPLAFSARGSHNGTEKESGDRAMGKTLPRWLIVAGIVAGVIPCFTATDLAADDRTETVFVRVPPADIGSRRRDQCPAEFRLRAAEFAKDRRIDPATLQVVRYDLEANKATSEPLPIRWYDDAIPYEFPDCEQNAHATDGLHLQFVPRPRWGEF